MRSTAIEMWSMFFLWTRSRSDGRVLNRGRRPTCIQRATVQVEVGQVVQAKLHCASWWGSCVQAPPRPSPACHPCHVSRLLKCLQNQTASRSLSSTFVVLITTFSSCASLLLVHFKQPWRYVISRSNQTLSPGTKSLIEFLPIPIPVSLLLSCSSFSSSSVICSSKLNPVNALQIRRSSLADMGSSETMAGINRAKSGFMTSNEAQMIATLISIVEKIKANVPDSSSN